MKNPVFEVADEELSILEFDLGAPIKLALIKLSNDLLDVPQVPGGGVLLELDLGAVPGHRAGVHTDPDVREVLQLCPGASRALELLDPLLQLPGGVLLFVNNHVLFFSCYPDPHLFLTFHARLNITDKSIEKAIGR